MSTSVFLQCLDTWPESVSYISPNGSSILQYSLSECSAYRSRQQTYDRLQLLLNRKEITSEVVNNSGFFGTPLALLLRACTKYDFIPFNLVKKLIEMGANVNGVVNYAMESGDSMNVLPVGSKSKYNQVLELLPTFDLEVAKKYVGYVDDNNIVHPPIAYDTRVEWDRWDFTSTQPYNSLLLSPRQNVGPLFYLGAIQRGCNIVKDFVAIGGDTEIKTNRGETALYFHAVNIQSYNVNALLIGGASPKVRVSFFKRLDTSMKAKQLGVKQPDPNYINETLTVSAFEVVARRLVSCAFCFRLCLMHG